MSAQKEQLKAIGTRLSQERQKKSISLEEIAAKTYIPQRLLSAIEDANLDRLPEPVFIQGFIRRFADAIGLDGMAMSKEFTVDLSPLPAPAAASLISNTIDPKAPKPTAFQPSISKAPEPSIPKAPEPSIPKAPEPSIPKAPEPSIPKAPEPPLVVRSEAPTPLPTPKASEPAAVRDPQPAEKLEPAAVRDSAPPRISTNEPPARLPLIALAAAIGLGVIGVLASTLFNRPAERSTPSAATSPTVKPSQAPTISPAPTASAPASPTPAASPSPGAATVKMNVTEESWVEVLVDGASVYEGTLPKGTQRSWSGKSVEVNTGNAGGVSLSYNNGEAKVMGATGALGSATFPPAP